MRFAVAPLLLLPLAACALDRAWGPDGARYYGDLVEVDFYNGVDRSWDAARGAAQSLGMPVRNEQAGQFVRRFDSAIGEHPVAIRVEADTSAYSFVQIRIGRDQDPEITTPFLREMERLLAES